MEGKTIHCEEFTGLFVVRNCENPPIKNCNKCNKNICESHSFKATNILNHVNAHESYKEANATLCITCFVEFDARLTNEIELYSKDRAIWRRKMIQRFHAEYPYMVFMAEDYGSLFDTAAAGAFIYHDSDEGSYFDS